MYENHVPWEDGVPADLRPAVKHLRETFDSAHFKSGLTTRFLCYSQLHPEAATPVDEIEDWAKALVQLKAWIGPAASQRFKEMFAKQTPSALFKAFFDFYLECLRVQIVIIFKALAEIGRANERLIETPPLEWAQSQTKHLIGSNIHHIDIWVRAVCDTDPYDPDEDLDEIINRTKWQAPRFLIMKPSRNQPYEAAKAWERVDRETSMRWRKMFYEHYVLHLESELTRQAGDAAVDLAKQPKQRQQKTTDSNSQQMGSPGPQVSEQVVLSASGSRKLLHSDDYLEVEFKNKKYKLTPLAASIVRVLHESHSKGRSGLTHSEIKSKTSCGKIFDAFRQRDGSAFWNDLIRGCEQNYYSLHLE